MRKEIKKDYLQAQMKNKNLTGIILAGGRNSRMNGNPKALLKFNNKFLIDIIIDIQKEFCDEIIIVTDDKNKFDVIENKNNVLLIEDEVSYRGPLSGIYYGLKKSKAQFNLVCSCDTPFIQKDVLKFMIEQAYEGKYDVVVPYVLDRFQPLQAVYSNKCLDAINESIKNNHFKITDFFGKVNVKKIEEEEIKKIDKDLKSFININTPAEYMCYKS